MSTSILTSKTTEISAGSHRLGWKELPVAKWPVGHPCLTDNGKPRHQTPDVGIARVVSIVPQDKVVPSGYSLRRQVGEGRSHDVVLGLALHVGVDAGVPEL